MNIENIEIGKIQKLTSPNPFCLITSRKEDGTTNLMALSWWTYVSNRPPVIAVCLSSRGYSGERIHKTGEFGLCLPDESLKEQAVKCGRCSGRDCDKVLDFDIPMQAAEQISAKIVEKSRVSLECKVIQELEVQDHRMFLAKVVAAHAHPEYTQLYAMEGYGRLETIARQMEEGK